MLVMPIHASIGCSKSAFGLDLRADDKVKDVIAVTHALVQQLPSAAVPDRDSAVDRA